MPNFQLADFNAGVDPNSEWAKQAAAQVMQAQAAPQMVATQEANPVAVQQTAPQPVAMPNNNGLAAKAAGVLTPLDDAGRALASQIAQFKMNYDAAQAAGDTAGMAQAHAGAEALRNAAGKYGVDLSRLGANDSTEAYKAMLQADYAKGVADVANMLTPQEYYQQQIQQNMANGMSRGRAEESALGALEAYEGKYRRTLGNAFARYGVNDQGEMNRFGAQIANLLYGQNPQSVALYDQYYANPMQQWKFDKNMEVQDKLYGQKLDFGQHQFEWNRDLNNDKFNFQLQLQKNQGDVQKTITEMKLYYSGLEADKQRQFLLDNPALAPLINGGKASGKGTGLSKEQSQNIQTIKNLISQAREDVAYGKERAKDGDALVKLQETVNDLFSKGKIDQETRDMAMTEHYKLNKDRQRKWQNVNYADKMPD
ncbi:hypothetical protein [Selenomonas sp. AE3005]|uniref:hypothetical protein n=1 Tax=Selenomonas sp. AE3005 TaxID=1485543 RepID=UPI000487BDC1|nr:hypothetical protein [Selenomonas sp. AE3005]